MAGHQRVYLFVAIAYLGVLALALQQARASEAIRITDQCWSPKELAFKADEIRIQHGVKAARISAPKQVSSTLPPVPLQLQGSIRRVTLPPGKKLIALTFDLCETAREIAGYDGVIVDYLRKHGVKATFFAGGHWLMTHPERAVQLAADPLFEIGNHSWTHGNMRLLSGTPLHEQITEAQAAYGATYRSLQHKDCVRKRPRALKAIPEAMTLFRFPYGSCSPKALQAVAKQGLLAIQWDVATGDPSKSQSADRIVNTVLRRARPGSIILGHANGRGWHTGKALPRIVERLKAQGYEFVTVSELLAAGKPVISRTCYDRKPGDTLAYEPKKKTHKKIARHQTEFAWPGDN